VRKLPEHLLKAVRALEASDVAGPIRTDTGAFLLVGLTSRREVRARTLSEARPVIEARLLPVLRQDAVERWLAEQEKKSSIEVFLEAGAETAAPEDPKIEGVSGS
jgi:hypothetical protein